MASRRIFLLDPHQLDPETIAVTFAKTSRSPLTFSEIAEELTEEKSAEFHEKWVVGYGHASVAEHAVLHIACENISRLAVEILESNRLASYTEKSTRYQKWNPDDFHVPAELNEHPLREEYIQTCRLLLQTYQKCMEHVQPLIEQRNPREAGENVAVWERRIRSKYVDVCRFLLPASSLANVGMTINARALEHAIQKMLSDPLIEVRAMGEEIKLTAMKVVPTLVKYANADPYLNSVENRLETSFAPLREKGEINDWMILIDFDKNGENSILAAALFRFSRESYFDCLKLVSRLNDQEKHELTESLFNGLGKFGTPVRELEHFYFTMEIVLDQGAYFELKRHRMMTLTTQSLTANLKYAVPRLITDAKMEEDYCMAMESALWTYQRLNVEFPAAAAYIVPNGFNRRVLLRMNLRSADHFLNIRSAPNAHFSLRRVAQRMAEEIRKAAPVIGPHLRVSTVETWQSIEKIHFTATAR